MIKDNEINPNCLWFEWVRVRERMKEWGHRSTVWRGLVTINERSEHHFFYPFPDINHPFTVIKRFRCWLYYMLPYDALVRMSVWASVYDPYREHIYSVCVWCETLKLTSTIHIHVAALNYEWLNWYRMTQLCLCVWQSIAKMLWHARVAHKARFFPCARTWICRAWCRCVSAMLLRSFRKKGPFLVFGGVLSVRLLHLWYTLDKKEIKSWHGKVLCRIYWFPKARAIFASWNRGMPLSPSCCAYTWWGRALYPDHFKVLCVGRSVGWLIWSKSLNENWRSMAHNKRQ